MQCCENVRDTEEPLLSVKSVYMIWAYISTVSDVDLKKN